MRPILPAAAALAAIAMLSGCAAALIPLAAVGALGKSEIDRAGARNQIVSVGAVNVDNQAMSDAATAPPTGRTANSDGAMPQRQPAAQGAIGEGQQNAMAPDQPPSDARGYLRKIYRTAQSGTAAPYARFADYALEQAKLRSEPAGQGRANSILQSAVLIPMVDIMNPERMDCAGKPLGVVIDLDAPDMASWSRSATLYRQNGLAEALGALRAAQITVVWLSDLPLHNARDISSILKDAGLTGAGENDDFLFLDRGENDRKQARRWDAARSYCIVAAAGDELSDFDELYDYLRKPDGAARLENMFDSGWFIAPPPLIVPPAQQDITTTPATTTMKKDNG